jgi:hypothetical protein
MGEIRREPAVKYYKECIRGGVPTSRREKAQKSGVRRQLQYALVGFLDEI